MARLLEAKAAFDSVDMRQEDFGRRLPGGGSRLTGESARAYVRLSLALAHEQPGGAGHFLGGARELLDSQRAVIQSDQEESGWTNDAIGALLDEVAMDRLSGKFDAVITKLSQINASREYRNLGGCSMALKCEVKLAYAKHYLAASGMRELPEALVKDLEDLVISADLTSHALIRIDALLLLAISSMDQRRKDYLDEAQQTLMRCAGYQLRDDTFRAIENGTPVSQSLSIFA